MHNPYRELVKNLYFLLHLYSKCILNQNNFIYYFNFTFCKWNYVFSFSWFFNTALIIDICELHIWERHLFTPKAILNYCWVLLQVLCLFLLTNDKKRFFAFFINILVREIFHSYKICSFVNFVKKQTFLNLFCVL